MMNLVMNQFLGIGESSLLIRIALTAACVLVALIAFTVWFLMLRAGWRWLQKHQQQAFVLHLASQSNLDLVYQLKVELDGIEKKVETLWLEDGRRLKPKKLKQVSYVEETIPEKVVEKKPAKPAKKQESELVKEARKVSKFANLIANIATTLAELLPGSLKKPFAAVASNIRQGQQSVASVKSDETHLKGQVNRLTGDVDSLKSMGPAGSGSTAAGPSQPKTIRRQVTTETTVFETRTYQPAQTSQYQLVFRPRRLLQAVSGPFTVTSQPVEVKDFPIYGSLGAESLSGAVQIKALSFGALVLSIIFGLGIMVLNAGWCFLVIRWILQFQS